MRRVRLAAFLFSDIGWRLHPDDRAWSARTANSGYPDGAVRRRRTIARAPLIATAIYHRYSGDEDFPRDLKNAGLLNEDDELRARAPAAWPARLAFALSASAVGELPHYPLRLTPTKIVLEVPTRRGKITGRSRDEAAWRAGRCVGPQWARS